MSEGSGEGNSSKEESDKDPGRQSDSLLRKQHSRQRSQMLRGLSTHSTRSGGSKKETPTFGWDTVKKSVKSGALQFVGLKPSKEEKLHWDAVHESILVNRAGAAGAPTLQPRMSTRSIRDPRGSIRDAPVSHITRYPYSSVTADVPATSALGPEKQRVASDDGDVSPAKPRHRDLSRIASRTVSEPGTATLRQASLYNKGTGRNQAVRTELKPDLWKLAYLGLKKLAPRPIVVEQPRSFLDLGEEDEEEGELGEETDFGPPLSAIREPDDDFFGAEAVGPTARSVRSDGGDYPDAVIARLPPTLPTIPDEERLSPPPSELKHRRIGLPAIIHDPLFGGYDRGYGGLGLPTLLLRFKYKECPQRVQRQLDDALLHKRPYFTYWLIVVHIMIMIISLAVYGFAPYGWDLQSEQAIAQQTNLAFDTEVRMVVPSVWGGPPQQALVLLGALYGPCMRRDRQLFDAIEEDRARERDSSGCCIRRDNSGCVQVLDEASDCPSRFAEFRFRYNNNSIRAVCGMSPETCVDPELSPIAFPGFDPLDVLTWPICRSDENEDSTESHLTCEITGRPCCVGIQAYCLIATREQCDFFDGRFHQDAFLCSQVDCLNGICGLLPFLDFNEPDQVYRLWIALFLHAGLLHVIFTVLFSVFVLRHVEKRLGWFRTAIIYILSGIGGNLVSAYFVPYNPKVGPAGSILGIVAYFFVFLIFEARLLENPWLEFLKLVILVIVLFLIGLLPFIDNFASIGGFVFGFFLSGIMVPYKPVRNILEKLDKQEKLPEGDRFTDDGRDYYWIFKIVMLAVGIPLVIGLFVLFFLLFYLVQDSWDGFTYVNCVPFTDTICLDLRGSIRDRGTVII